MNIKNPLILSSLNHSKRPPLLYCDMCGGESKSGLHNEKWEFSGGRGRAATPVGVAEFPLFNMESALNLPHTCHSKKAGG